MGNPSVNHKHLPDTASDRLHTALKLRNHPSADYAVSNKLRSLINFNAVNQRGRIVLIAEDALRIGKGNQTFGVQLRRDGRRRRVGVDVIGITAVVDSDG